MILSLTASVSLFYPSGRWISPAVASTRRQRTQWPDATSRSAGSAWRQVGSAAGQRAAKRQPAGRLGDFLGREAVLRRRQAGLARRLVQFQLGDPEPLLYHAEPILRDGKLVGHLASGGYGHHLGAAVGLGYVACAPGETQADMLASRYEIDVAGRRVPAIASFKPLYDPAGTRIRL